MIHINLDCDGVLADFLKGACAAHNKPINGSKWNFYEDWGLSETEFWAKCKGEEFWLNLEPYHYAHELVSNIRLLCEEYRAELTIITAPSLDPESVSAKIKWLNQHFNIKPRDILLGSKKWLLANNKSVLIDDYVVNINNFNKHGGHGILFRQPWNCSYLIHQKYNWHESIESLILVLDKIQNNETFIDHVIRTKI